MKNNAMRVTAVATALAFSVSGGFAFAEEVPAGTAETAQVQMEAPAPEAPAPEAPAPEAPAPEPPAPEPPAPEAPAEEQQAPEAPAANPAPATDSADGDIALEAEASFVDMRQEGWRYFEPNSSWSSEQVGEYVIFTDNTGRQVAWAKVSDEGAYMTAPSDLGYVDIDGYRLHVKNTGKDPKVQPVIDATAITQDELTPSTVDGCVYYAGGEAGPEGEYELRDGKYYKVVGFGGGPASSGVGASAALPAEPVSHVSSTPIRYASGTIEAVPATRASYVPAATNEVAASSTATATTAAVPETGDPTTLAGVVAAALSSATALGMARFLRRK